MCTVHCALIQKLFKTKMLNFRLNQILADHGHLAAWYQMPALEAQQIFQAGHNQNQYQHHHMEIITARILYQNQTLVQMHQVRDLYYIFLFLSSNFSNIISIYITNQFANTKQYIPIFIIQFEDIECILELKRIDHNSHNELKNFIAWNASITHTWTKWIGLAR